MTRLLPNPPLQLTVKLPPFGLSRDQRTTTL